jgi:hypothetical protein
MINSPGITHKEKKEQKGTVSEKRAGGVTPTHMYNQNRTFDLL